jgi:hypothetical protein
MRNIDPATPHDEWYIAQTLQVRLFWLSLLLVVDDQGRFAANPALVRSAIFPADDISLAEVEALLGAVDGKVRFYEVKGNRYGQLANWWKYQGSAAWMGPSRFPPPEGWADRYRYHAKGNKIVQSSTWRDTPEAGPDETVEAETASAEAAAQPGGQQGSRLGSKEGSEQGSPLDSQLGSSEGRSDGDVDGDVDDDGESEGDGDDGSDTARPNARADPTPLSRSQFWDSDPNWQSAQSLLLQASGLAALPPTEYARVKQVQAMIRAYGEEKTLTGLRAEREKWCRTRGRNGSLYSLLNMGWVDWADEALSGAGPPLDPRYAPLPPPPPFAGTVPIPEHLRRPSKAERDAQRQRAAAPFSDEPDGTTGPQEGSVTE